MWAGGVHKPMKGAVVDVDGTVLRGETPIGGALEGIGALREAGVRLAFFSNNPTITSEGLARRLERAGVETEGATVLTSASLTARHVGDNYPDARVHVVGEKDLVEALAERVKVVDEPADATVAVVSVDRHLSYDDIRSGMFAARTADAFFSTDPDAVVPTDEGDIPGTGSVTSAVETAAGRVATTVGKPSEIAAQTVLDALGTRPEETVFVGDRLDTDIALGENVGATTAVVLTGVTDEDDVRASEHRPDHVLDTFAGVADLL